MFVLSRSFFLCLSYCFHSPLPASSLTFSSTGPPTHDLYSKPKFEIDTLCFCSMKIFRLLQIHLLSWKALALFTVKRLYLCFSASLYIGFCKQQPTSTFNSNFLNLLSWSARPTQAPAFNQWAGCRCPITMWHCYFLLTQKLFLFWSPESLWLSLPTVTLPFCFIFGSSDLFIFLLLGEGISF